MKLRFYRFPAYRGDAANSQAGFIADSAGNLYATSQNAGATFKGDIFKLVPPTEWRVDRHDPLYVFRREARPDLSGDELGRRRTGSALRNDTVRRHRELHVQQKLQIAARSSRSVRR